MTLRTNRGFTLIEVLLVAVIIGFVAAIATPSFVNSLKGQRLRQATRTVMSCGRYARTMSVSRQQSMNLILTLGSGHVAVEEGPAPRRSSEAIYTRDQVEALSNDAPHKLPPLDEPPPAKAPAEPLPSRSLARDLEGVKVKSLSIHDGLQTEEGAVRITYKSNGTCPPYEVVLADEDGTESVILVDFLGDATHEEK
jgi:type II secretion system protein H